MNLNNIQLHIGNVFTMCIKKKKMDAGKRVIPIYYNRSFYIFSLFFISVNFSFTIFYLNRVKIPVLQVLYMSKYFRRFAALKY